jgi:hypothetical protein
MFRLRSFEQGDKPMASPALLEETTAPAAPHDDVKVVSPRPAPRITGGSFVVRMLPMIGIGGILAASVYFKPSGGISVGALCLEIVFAVLAVAAWAPKHHHSNTR